MLPSGLPETIDDEEDLARFLFSKSHYSKMNGFVKGAAFMPSQKYKELSVCRHGKEPKEELWKIGYSAADLSKRTLKGAAILKAKEPRRVDLDVKPDEGPDAPDRHALIINWPWEEELDVTRAKQKLLADSLATASELVCLPEDQN